MLYLFSFLVGVFITIIIFNKPIKIEINKTLKEEKAEVGKPIATKIEPDPKAIEELNKLKQDAEVYAGIMNEFYGMDVIEDGKGKEKE